MTPPKQPPKHTFTMPMHIKTDVNGDEYLIGSTDIPMYVDLREATFLVFFPEDGEEMGTLMIRPRQLVPRPTPAGMEP